MPERYRGPGRHEEPHRPSGPRQSTQNVLCAFIWIVAVLSTLLVVVLAWVGLLNGNVVAVAGAPQFWECLLVSIGLAVASWLSFGHLWGWWDAGPKGDDRQLPHTVPHVVLLILAVPGMIYVYWRALPILQAILDRAIG